MASANKNTNKTPRLIDCVSQPLVLENWYTETFFADFSMEYHTHPQIELMYCVHGQFDFVYKYDAEDEEAFYTTVNQNSFILVNTGYYHKVANMAQTTKIINLEFLPYGASLKNNDLQSQPLKIFAIPLEKLFPICTELHKFIKNDKDFYVFIDNNKILNTMNEFIRQMAENELPEERSLIMMLLTNKLFIDISHCIFPDSHKKTGIIYVDAAMRYINSNLLKKLNITEIASAVGISSVYLQKLFKIQFGKSVYEVITEKRMTQAKHLLEQTNINIAEIAKQCGFGSREQLDYAFQKSERRSPSEYRKKQNAQKIRFFSHYGETKIIEDN